MQPGQIPRVNCVTFAPSQKSPGEKSWNRQHNSICSHCRGTGQAIHRVKVHPQNLQGSNGKPNNRTKSKKVSKQDNNRPIAPSFSFMDQEAYDALPITPWLNKQGQPIMNHPDLPEEYKVAALAPDRLSQPKVMTTTNPYPENMHGSPDSGTTRPSYPPKAPLSEASASLHPLPSAEPFHVMRIHTRTAALKPAATGMIFMSMTIHQTQLMNGKISHQGLQLSFPTFQFLRKKRFLHSTRISH